jgi:penicillin-binding protein 1A
MNQMMNRVVTDGTGNRAALEFTHSAGKTGTSTGPRDVWFVGFTGKYVGSVWFGRDDNTPMAGGATGGQLAAPVWHSFMSVAHTDMNIPTIPGLAPHPTQIAEQQRIAMLKETDPITAAEVTAVAAAQTQSSLMPEQTKAALKKLSEAMRKAAGLPVPASTGGTGPAPSGVGGPAGSAASPGGASPGTAPSASPPPGNRIPDDAEPPPANKPTEQPAKPPRGDRAETAAERKAALQGSAPPVAPSPRQPRTP